MITILIVVLLLVMLGGGGYYYRDRWGNPQPGVPGTGPNFGLGGGLIGLVVIILLLFYLFGRH